MAGSILRNLLDEHERKYVEGRRGAMPDGELEDNIRQYRAINTSNAKQANDDEAPATPGPEANDTDVSSQPDQPHYQGNKNAITPYNAGERSHAELSAHVDKIMDHYDGLETNLRQKRAELDTRGFQSKADYDNAHDIDSTLQHINRSRDLILSNNQWYKRGSGATEEKPVGEEGPGLLSKVLTGAKDTAKFAIGHPGEALKNASLGVDQFRTMPFRALESVLGTKEDKFSPAKNYMKGRESDVAASTKEAGVDPRSTGPVVSQAVGSMALPVGPTLKAGQYLKNALKGGTFGAGAYTGERVAANEPVDTEGVSASGGIGAGLGTLFGLLTRGKGKAPATQPEKAPVAGLLEHKPPMVTPEPPKRLPAPEPKGPDYASRYDDMAKAVADKTARGEALNPAEERFVLYAKTQKGTPPPNVAGERTDVRPLASMLKPKEPIDVTPRTPEAATTVPPAAAPATSPLAKVLTPKSAEPPTVVPKTAPGTPEWNERLAGLVKKNTPVITPKAGVAIPPKDLLDTVKAMDAAKDQASKEALLGDVVSGKLKVSDIPVKRGSKGPKAKAPAPAVKGEAGEVSPKLASGIHGKVNLDEPFVHAINKQDGRIEEAHSRRDFEYDPKTGTHGNHHSMVFSKGVLEREYSGEVVMAWKDDNPVSKTRGQWVSTEGALPKQLQDRIAANPSNQVKVAASGGKIAPTRADTVAQKLIAEGKEPTKAIEMAEFKTEQRVSPEFKASVVKPDERIKLEDYIKQKGYGLTEREPFPGEKSYDVRDAKGNVIARGDRENILHGMNARNEGKGIKLYSFGGGVDELAGLLKSKMSKLPDDTTVSNSPHREKMVNMALRNLGLQTPQFAMRHSQSGSKVVNAALDAEDLIKTRVNDLLYDPKRLDAKGEYQPTNLFHYFSMDAAQRQKVNDVLVLGDKTGHVFTDAELVKSGLTIEQIQGYRGVREALGKVASWVKDLGGDSAEFDPKIAGYIPRVWKGNWEIFEGGVKHVPKKGETELGSSFSTLSEASREAHRIKAARPDAKLDIRFFADPDYLPGRGILDARAVARVKKNLETMGKLDSKAIDEAFKMGRSVTGFAKHLLERKDAAGYETQDLDKVLFSYFNQAARKVEFKKVREVVTNTIQDHKKDLTGPQVEYLQSYVERVAGKPSWDKLAFEQFIKHTPIGKWIDPVSSSVGLKTMNDYITYKSLGFGNVSWALINLDTLSRHVWPMLQNEAKGMGNAFASEKYLFGAVKSFYQDKALRQKLAHNGVIDIQMMSESRPEIGHQLGQGKWTPQRVIMFLGLATEEFTRGVGAIARYKMALDQGFDDKMAMRLASRFVAETAARYSKAGKAPIFTGPTGETLGKFKPYLGVMMQNMYKAFESKDIGVVTRYMLASLGVGGILGQVPGAENVDHLATKHLGFSPIQWAYEHIPEGVLTGAASVLPGKVGLPNVDLSRKAGLPDIFPSDLSGWAGPVLNTYGQAVADIANGEHYEALRDLMPTSIRNVLAVTQKPGYVTGRFDKPSVELPPGKMNQAVRGMGFQSPEEVRASRDYSYVHTMAERRQSALQRLTRRIYQNKASDSEREEFARMGGTNRSLREEGRRESMTSRERQQRHLPKTLRHLIPPPEQ